MKAYNSPLDITTPYDETIPSVDEPSTQFYIDVMRIYLALYEGTATVEEAVKAVEKLKENPEFVKYPVNPTMAPLNEEFRNKVLSNLQTLKKFNLVTKDSVKSAYSFAFLTPDVPMSETDLQVLKALERDPLCTLVDAAESVGVTSRTIARSIERLEKDLILRVGALMDMTAFGVQPVLFFFTLADGIEWEMVQDGFARYPFTKSILKTTMTDLGYVSFLIPGLKENQETFVNHIKDISPTLFDYSSLHPQVSSGADSNISLFKDGQWEFCKQFSQVLEDDTIEKDTGIRLLECRGWQRGLDSQDFLLLSHYRNLIRAPPRVISENLRMYGIDMEPKMIAQSIRRYYSKNLLLPILSYRGIGLSSNFCIEISCSEEWRERILRAIVFLPTSMYYLSKRGIVIWSGVPSQQQVEYYQLFRSLESIKGVHSVRPIMTIMQKGSRHEFDMIQYWKFRSKGWTIDPSQLSLAEYFE